MANAIWNGVYPSVFGRSCQLSLNIFFDLITPSMRKVDNGEEKKQYETYNNERKEQVFACNSQCYIKSIRMQVTECKWHTFPFFLIKQFIHLFNPFAQRVLKISPSSYFTKIGVLLFFIRIIYILRITFPFCETFSNCTPNWTTFAKELFWLNAWFKKWWNDCFKTKWLSLYNKHYQTKRIL